MADHDTGPGRRPAGHAYHHAHHLLGLVPGPDIGVPAAASLLGLSVDRTARLLRSFVADGIAQETSAGRYRGLHDPACRSVASCGDGAARRRLLEHYLHTACAADRLIAPHRPDPGLTAPVSGCRPEALGSREAALAWLDAEHDCLTALRVLAKETGRHLVVLRLASALNGHYVRRGRSEEQLAQWQDAVAAARALGDPRAQVTAYRYGGQAASRAGLHDQAVGHLARAVEIAEREGDPDLLAWAHYIFAWVEEQAGREDEALGHAVRARALFRTSGDVRAEADALNAAGWYHARLGDLADARAHCTQALGLARDHGYEPGQAAALDSLGLLAQRAGRHTEALDHYGAALDLCRSLGNTYQEPGTLERLGDSHAALGGSDEARGLWARALGLYRDQRREEEATAAERRLATAR